MDLIQLLLPQQSAKPTEISDEIQANEDNTAKEDKATFIAIMAHFLHTQEVSETIPLIEESIKQANSGLEEIIPKEVGPCEQSQLPGIEEPILDSKELQLVPEDQTIALQDRISLAWFESESFEPPSGKPVVNANVLEDSTTIVVAEAADQDNSDTTEVTAIEVIPQIAQLILPENLDRELRRTPEEPDLQIELSGASVAKESKPIKLANAFSVDQAGEADALALATANDKPGPKLSMTPEESGVSEKESNNVLAVFNENDGDLSSIMDPNGVKALSMPIIKALGTEGGYSLDLSQNISSSDWSEQFNQQIIWLSQQKIKTAIIKLNPQELGPIEVKIDLMKEETKLNIRTQTAGIGDLIEHAIPQLRELMHSQGLNLSQVNVESNSNQRHSQQQAEQQPRQKLQANNSTVVETSTQVKISKGIIDYFA